MQSPRKIFVLQIQGAPKVRSSNFMHYNFWSKLYFYMKFLQDVYFSIEYMSSEFQWLACPYCFLSHSVAVASWSGIQRVDPQMIHFELFYHLVRRSQFNPQTIFVWFRQLKKAYFGHSSKKDNHPRPLPQQCFCTSFQIWGELGVTWQTKQRVFLPSQRPLNLNILNTFSWPFLDC